MARFARRALVAAGALLLAASCGSPPPSPASFGPAERVTLDAAAEQLPGGGTDTDVSGDGRLVLFHASGDLVEGPDEANLANAYLRDSLTGELTWLRDPSLDPATQGVERTHLLSADASAAIAIGTGLDGTSGRGSYLFDVAASTWHLLGPAELGNQLDLSSDGRTVAGPACCGDPGLSVYEVATGSWEQIHDAGSATLSPPKFVQDDTRLAFTVSTSVVRLWTIQLDGTDAAQVPADLGAVEPLNGWVTAAGDECVLVQTGHPVTGIDALLVDVGTGGTTSTVLRSYTRPSGTTTPIGAFRGTAVADDCRRVLGWDSARGSFALVDVTAGWIIEAFAPFADEPATAVLSEDGRTVAATTSDALVGDDTNGVDDGYVRRR